MQTTSLAMPGGYIFQEASNFIEFCVELDNEDDRLKQPDRTDPRPQIDGDMWNPLPVFDSRKAIAHDYAQYKQLSVTEVDSGARADDDIRYWSKVFDKLEERARERRIDPSPETIQHNPNLNGFGPWQNAWLLYEGRERNTGKYAIAIRGTVFSTAPSVVEDVFFHPVKAKAFLSEAVSFADSNAASIHSGFAHATFTLLLDRRYGILQALNDMRVPPDSQLYIVGHSQGAAMATLVHAFMYHAMRDADSGRGDPLALGGKRYRLKSYAFAQPKPGNYSFASEFAGATQLTDNAIVVNNDYDPVPKVPLTLETMEDLAIDFHGRFLVARVVRSSASLGAAVRGAISEVAEPFVKESAEGYGNFYRFASIQPIRSDETASSWNFVPAGKVIIVFGQPNPNQGDDIFFQHHATTYRRLLRSQLGESVSVAAK